MADDPVLAHGVSITESSEESPGPSAKLTLSLGDEECTVYLFGAHVVSWKSGGKERLWMSSLSVMDGTAPIRGGVPIAFPQFADQGPLKLHGFAREQLWRLVQTSADDGCCTVVLMVTDTEATRALWPHEFQLQYTVALRPGALFLSLEVRNTGSEAWSFTSCLHTYFATPDIRQVKLIGLKGAGFTDKVDGLKEKIEEEEAIMVASASEASCGFVDRIYKTTPKSLQMLDEGAGVNISIKQTESWRDTVVFNPWEEGKKGPKGPDFDDDGFNYMLCVEPSITAHAPQVVEPGASWTGMQSIQIQTL